MIKSEVEIAGTTRSSVGRFDAYNNATSRVVQRFRSFAEGRQPVEPHRGLQLALELKDKSSPLMTVP